MSWNLLKPSGVIYGLLVLLSGAPADGFAQQVSTQVIRDGTIGPDASVQPTATALPEGGTLYDVGEALGQRSADGGVVFHSFDRFEIGTGDTVQFRIAALPTRSVVTRVTGGLPSNIYGRLELFPDTIAVQIGLPEFYLINPAGIVFGPGGAVSSLFPFIATTADVLEFGDGAILEARADAPPPLLTIANVTAFDFRGSTGSISADGAQIAVRNGTIGLIAGTPGTRIGLNSSERSLVLPPPFKTLPARSLDSLSLLSRGSAPISSAEGRLTLRDTQVMPGVAAFFGSRNTALFAGGSIDAQGSGSDALLLSGGLQFLSPGRVSIAGGRLDGSFVGAVISITARGIDLSKSMLAGTFMLTSMGAPIRLTDSALLGDVATLKSDVGIAFERSTLMFDLGLASLGDSLELFDRSIQVRLDAPSIEIYSSAIASGELRDVPGTPVPEAFDISIRADRVRVSDQSVLSSQVLISPLLVDPLTGLPLDPPQRLLGRRANVAGSISIEAGDIELLNSRITSAAVINPVRPELPIDQASAVIEDFVLGSAGEIRLDATRSVRIAGSQIDTSVDSDRSEQVGSISIAAPSVRLESSIVRSESVATQAGSIDVQSTADLVLSGTSLTSNASGSGRAGSVSVSGSDIRLERGSSLLSSNTGLGPAGSIRVEAGSGSLALSEGSRIATRANEGPAPGRPADGNVDITLTGSLRLEDASAISADVDLGQGGDIRISTPQSTVLRGGSRILAGTGNGQGGRIDLVTGAFLVDSTSSVNADAGVGASGTVEIRSPDVDLQGGIAGLSVEFLNASALLRPTCDARREGASGLYVAGARGLPASPDDWLLAFDAAPVLADVGAADVSGATDLLRLARSQQASGSYAESLPMLERALAEAERAQDAGRVASVLGGLGNAQQALGREGSAEVLLTRGASLASERGDAALAGRLEHDLGNHYASAGADAKARERYARAAEQAERSGDGLGAARALAAAARLAVESGDDAGALLARAASKIDALPDGAPKAELLIHVGRSHAESARRAAGSELHDRSLLSAHDHLREAARLARTLDVPRLGAYALGNLAELYQSERRWEEALALTREALALAERAQSSDALYRWQWLEGQLLRAQGKAHSAVRAYRRAVQVIEETRQESRARYGSNAAFFRRSLAPVYLDLADALLRGSSSLEDPSGREALLLEARATVEKLKAAELRNYLRDDCAAQLEARTASLDSLATAAAVVYPIALRDRLELLVRLPSGLERFTVPVGSEQIDAEARAFRVRVQDRTSTAYRPVAQRLYDWLVRPYAARLAASGVDTLVFVPDGVLSSIPMAALHDGERFLAERFALATAPGLSLVDARPLNLERVKPLIGGVSQPIQEFAPLGSVPRELEAIRALFGGEVLLDAGFQAGRIQDAVEEARPTLVHFASHAVFTGDPGTSFLLTHDGRITMDELGALLARTRFRSDPIELLVLSACETAVGNERAALGLAGVAVRAGARSALGSLWAISDEATYPLTVHFYGRLHEPGLSRAAALRHAQRALLASPEFSHPFYWSAFVLISNWL